jgi:hypothetical protein
MGRTLGLTSPLTTGDDVRETQRLLQSQGPDTPYGSFYPGAIHGIYDELTATGARKAKWALGYPKQDLDGLAGDQLRGLLRTKPKDLPPGFADRRADRLTQETKPKPLRLRVLAKAQSELGYRESPVNRTKFGAWYGLDGNPWCAMFCTWAAEMCDSDSFVRGSRYAYCPFVVADARQFKNGLWVVAARDVKPGHLVLFDWDNDGTADHIGFASGVVTTGGSVPTVEGNTQPGSGGDQSNGGGVYARTRSLSDVIAFVGYA